MAKQVTLTDINTGDIIYPISTIDSIFDQYNNGTQVYPTAIGNAGTATTVIFKFPTLSKGVYILNVTTTSGLSQTVSGTVS